MGTPLLKGHLQTPALHEVAHDLFCRLGGVGGKNRTSRKPATHQADHLLGPPRDRRTPAVRLSEWSTRRIVLLHPFKVGIYICLCSARCDIVCEGFFLEDLILKGKNRWQIKRSPTMLMSTNAYVKSPLSGSLLCEPMDAHIRCRSGFCGMAKPFSFLANL